MKLRFLNLTYSETKVQGPQHEDLDGGEIWKHYSSQHQL